MKYLKTGIDRNVLVTILRYRMFLPYGRIEAKSSYSVLLNYGRKMLINTGVIENQPEVEGMLKGAGIGFKDLDCVINMTSQPSHIGLNAVIQYKNPHTLFFAHPGDIAYIEDTVLAHEEKYVPGFYKLVAGNTENVRRLADQQRFNLGKEVVRVQFQDNPDEPFALYLENSGILIEGQEVRKAKPLPVFTGRKTMDAHEAIFA